MPIVDAQIHVWGGGLPSQRAHRQVTAFTTAELPWLSEPARIMGQAVCAWWGWERPA